MNLCKECRTREIKYVAKGLCDTCNRRLLRQNVAKTEDVAEVVSQSAVEDSSFVPNWKSNPNIKNTDEAIAYILHFMSQDPKMDGVVMSVKGRNWIINKGTVKPVS